MTEKNLTESEIMKALECCANWKSCKECPLYSWEDCTGSLKEFALDLLNRKNAEIGKLNFENLQMIASIKNLKAEAIKEFAERLEVRYCNIPMWGKVAIVFMKEIAKEMGVEEE